MANQYILRKGYKEWSSNTVVEVLEAPWLNSSRRRRDKMALCYHESTGSSFEVPAELLIPRRMRGK